MEEIQRLEEEGLNRRAAAKKLVLSFPSAAAPSVRFLQHLIYKLCRSAPIFSDLASASSMEAPFTP